MLADALHLAAERRNRPPVAYCMTTEQASAALAISTKSLLRILASGAIESFVCAGRRVIKVDDIATYVESLPRWRTR